MASIGKMGANLRPWEKSGALLYLVSSVIKMFHKNPFPYSTFARGQVA